MTGTCMEIGVAGASARETQSGRTVLIAARGVSRHFGPVRAVREVDLAVEAGSIHAVTGENGAGKSTLMKMFAGVVQPSAGTIVFKDKAVRLSSPLQALKLGISTVFQEFTLIPNLTVAENIFLGREPRTRLGAIDYRTLEAEAKRALSHIGHSIPHGRLVRNLTVAEQQIVEIAKGIAADADVFIFDEPTAALNTADVAQLHALIRNLRSRNKAVLYISHRLEEIFSLCDTVSVMKDGAHVACLPTAGIDERGLITLMVGREMDEFFPTRASQLGPPVLRVRDLSLDGAAPVGLTLYQNEIVGLAGLEGQGQREIVRAMAGVRAGVFSSYDKFDEKGGFRALHPGRGVPDMVSRGVGFVPEDRKGEGLFLELSIRDNITLGPLLRGGMYRVVKDSRDLVAGLMRSMNVRARSVGTRTGSLSGGNQQKVLIGRWLVSGVNVLLIEEPTRGVDVGAKAEIYRLLRDFAAAGGSVLVLSRELPELIGLCDRILVVHDRQLVADLPAAETTEHAIIHSAIGTRPTSPAAAP
jgi:ribose transport system ATP-binding protein